MNSAVLKRKFTGKPVTMPYSAAKVEKMQRIFDESREKVLAARNEEIEKAYQKGKEDGINRTVSVLSISESVFVASLLRLCCVCRPDRSISRVSSIGFPPVKE